MIALAVLVLAVAVAAAVAVLHERRPQRLEPSGRRILFPFAGTLSQRALDAALRLARADGATLVPVYLTEVPLRIPLDAPVPRQCAEGLPLLETIEQRAARVGVPVDSRIERGRTLRHALRQAIEHERYDRLVVAAASARSTGFHGDDVAWLLDRAPGEVVIIRESDRDVRAHGDRAVDRQPEVRHRARRVLGHPDEQPLAPAGHAG